MSKATSIKEAIQKFEKDRQVVAAATAKVLKLWHARCIHQLCLCLCLIDDRLAGGAAGAYTPNREDGCEPEQPQGLHASSRATRFYPQCALVLLIIDLGCSGGKGVRSAGTCRCPRTT